MEANLTKNPETEHDADSLFEANLAAFRANAPYLHKRLAAIETPHSKLVVESDGTFDMALLDQRFYGCDAASFANEQLEAYFDSPHRFTLAEPNPEHLEGLNAGFCNALKEGGQSLGVTFDRKLVPDDAHFLVVFGVGLGLHLEVLFERTQAKVACLIEPNIECIYHSLFVVDWAALFERFEDQGCELSIVVERVPKRASRKVQTALRRTLATFVDGIYLYTHYPSAILQQTLAHFRKDLAVALSGLGYFEDEVIMTANATANLAGRKVKMLCEAQPPKDAPVFIVGSGPSVDQDLDFIVAHRERAFVFSIGTALRILLKRGVIPDFHFEIENSEFNAGLMKRTAEELDLSGIVLVASVTVRPRMTEFMDETYLFFREELSATKLYAGGLRLLQPAGPTVANAAFAAGLRMGFREYYLFGTDMGTRVEGNFHSKESVFSLGLFRDFSKEDNRFPANFGGEVIGERILNWSRNTLEAAITANPDIRVYNCSDGARIAGALPRLSRTIRFSHPEIDRDAIKRDIAGYISLVTPERSAGLWCHATRQDELNDFMDRIESIVVPIADQLEPTDDWLSEIACVTKEVGLKNPIVTSYLSGSLQIMAGVTRWYDRRVEDQGQRASYRRHAASVMLTWFKRMRGELETLYDEVEEHFQGRLRIEDLHRHGEDDLLLPAN